MMKSITITSVSFLMPVPAVTQVESARTCPRIKDHLPLCGFPTSSTTWTKSRPHAQAVLQDAIDCHDEALKLLNHADRWTTPQTKILPKVDMGQAQPNLLPTNTTTWATQYSLSLHKAIPVETVAVAIHLSINNERTAWECLVPCHFKGLLISRACKMQSCGQ